MTSAEGGENGAAEDSFVELLDLVAKQQREDVLDQVLKLLLQCSRDGALVCFLISSLQNAQRCTNAKSAVVISALRRLLRLVGSKPVLSVTATEILINFTADEQLANLMLLEYKDMASLLLENLKRQQQQQQTRGFKSGEDEVPLHLSVSLMLLSNVTRHKQAIQVLFNPELPLPDFHLLPFVLLLHEAPRNPDDAFWKEQGVFLLHVLQNATSSDAAVDFLLRRRMGTINNVLRLLRHMPTLCQKPLLTLALRLCCREQLHTLLLPTEPASLRRKVERQLKSEVHSNSKVEGKLETKTPPTEAAEECQLVHELCCLLYPSKGSAMREKAMHELREQETQEAPSRRPQEQSETQSSEEVTEKQRLRFLNPSVDEQSYGPSDDSSIRELAVECISALALSPHARETLRWFGVYEVLRAVFCIEPEECIREKVEGMVHVLVFSEEELREQDQQQQQSTAAAKPSLALRDSANAVSCQP